MSQTLGSIAIGLDVDLATFDAKMREATTRSTQQFGTMSAEMKRTSREGAESLRLIGENLGLHISRPVSRFLTQEYPAFATALQSLLGGAVFGVVADIGFRAFEKISKSIEGAKKAQEEWRDASLNASEVVDNVLGGIEKKLASIKGQSPAIKFSLEGAEEAKRGIDEIEKALEKEAAAAEKANSLSTRFWSAAGDFLSHEAEGWATIADAFGGDAIAEAAGTKNLHDKLFDSQELKNMKAALADMKTDLAIVLNDDKDKGTHNAITLINRDLQAARDYLHDMQQAGDKAGISLAQAAVTFYSDAAKVEEGTKKLTAARNAQAGSEADKKAIHDAQEEMKGWNQENNKSVEAWVKLNAEIAKAEKKMNENVLKDTARRAKEFGLGFEIAPPSGAPALKDQEELAKISGTWGSGESDTERQTESWKKAGQILEQIETPLQKYTTGLAILKELQSQGRLSADQLALGQQKLQEQLVQSSNHVREMERQLIKLLESSNTVGAGLRAAYLQMQIEASDTGKFTFDVMSGSVKGLEDTFIKSFNVMGATHRERVLEMRRLWNEFFIGLDEKLLKFALNKGLTSLLEGLSKTSIGQSLGGLLSQGSDVTKGAALQVASTTLQTGSTMLITASTTLQTAAATLSAAGAAGAGGGAGALFGLPKYAGFASGTDSAPGGMAWVGEQGPELLNLPGGTSVTPAASVRSGSGDQHFYIDAKGAELGVEEKIMRAIEAARPRMIGEAMANISEIQRRSVARK